MQRVLLYSVLLTGGMGLSQVGVFQYFSVIINALTMIFLAYIIIEVGMEFDIDKSRLGSNGESSPSPDSGRRRRHSGGTDGIRPPKSDSGSCRRSCHVVLA